MKEFNGKQYCYPPSIDGLYNGTGHWNPLSKLIQFPTNPHSSLKIKNNSPSEYRNHDNCLKKIHQQQVEMTLQENTPLLAQRSPSFFSPKVDLPQLCTLHFTGDLGSIAEKKVLLGALYRKFLNEDPLFHYFFEPDLIIRMSKRQVCEKIENYLRAAGIECAVYDYPIPAPCTALKCYGENPEGIVHHNLKAFLHIFHEHAKVALLFPPAEQLRYITQVIQLNLRQPLEEVSAAEKSGQYLDMLSASKLSRQINFLDNSIDVADEFNVSPPPALAPELLNGVPSEEQNQQLRQSIHIIKKYSRIINTLPRKEENLSPQQISFSERILHTWFNMAGYTRHEEGEYLAWLAGKEYGLRPSYQEAKATINPVMS